MLRPVFPPILWERGRGEALKKTLGPEDKVRTLSLRVQPVRTPGDKSRPSEIKGYQAVHRFQLEVRDLERLGRVIDTALKSGASRSNAKIVAWAASSA